MQELIALSVILAVGAALGFRLIRDTRAAARAQQLQARVQGLPRNEHNKYHAVTITPGRPSCALAAQLVGKRFLSADAPALPLPGCAARCHCRYIHHADRRAADDRRFPFGVSKSAESERFTERRRGERRKAPTFVLG